MTSPTLASGGLVFRPGDTGYEILVVHRPRYDDWSLPKGKDDPGETPMEAARREVEEETGWRTRVVAPLQEVSYSTPSGERKLVRYFAMRPVAFTGFTPNPEVDEVRWVPMAEAAHILTYPRDRQLVESADLEQLAGTGTLYLVRHAAAGSRHQWEGDDRLRPLTAKGARQAAALAEQLGSEPIDQVLTSPYVRCRQTVEPLAVRLGLEVLDHPALAEGSTREEQRHLVSSLAGSNAVLCSHGDVIPELLEWLASRGAPLPPLADCKKGSVWVVELEGGRPVAARYTPPPEV
jgi:8-oxo-dGTP diphosphatase